MQERKKTLKILMEKINKVCIGKIKPKPKIIKYSHVIEECEQNIEENLIKMLPDDLKSMSRWISLKILDGDERILSKIEEKFNINILKNEKLKELNKEINDILDFNGIKEKK